MHHYFGSIAIDRVDHLSIGRLRMVQHHQAASGRTHQHLRDPRDRQNDSQVAVLLMEQIRLTS